MVVQRDEDWVKAATPEQIDAARRAGELVEYCGGTVNSLGNQVDSSGRPLTA